MPTLTWITEKELEREIKKNNNNNNNNKKETYFVGRKIGKF